jgi:predicted amidohydrolase
MARCFASALILYLVAALPAYAGGDEQGSSVRVALVQLDASDAGNFQKIESFAKQAKQMGAELVIFPEASSFGWLNPKAFTEAEPIPGAQASKFAAVAVAAKIWVATGLEERGPKAGGGTNTFHAYDSGILINPQGEIVLHHRKHNVLKNAFDQDACRSAFGVDECGYTPGPLSDIKIAETPFGRTAILVCADAYTYDLASLQALKAQNPEFVIVPWGVTAGTQAECGTEGFNATGYAARAAKYLATAYVLGANAVGERRYGRFRPSWYCGTSGFATPAGEVGGVADTAQSIAVFDIPITTH